MAKGFKLQKGSARRPAPIAKVSAPRSPRAPAAAPPPMGLLTKIGTPMQGAPIPAASMSPKMPKMPTGGVKPGRRW